MNPCETAEMVPEIRYRTVNEHDLNPGADYVLYWMIANRRTGWNFSLQRAVESARELKKPLVILEALRCGYRWASDRFHQFVIQGMADNARQLVKKKVLYYPYLERAKGDGHGLLAALAERACVVVSDDYPCFFLPAMLRLAGRLVPVTLELVDSNGLLPMRAADKVFSRAHDFRRFLHKNLHPHLDEFPEPDPLSGQRLAKPPELPAKLRKTWPAADVQQWADDPKRLADLPIDHDVPIADIRGGPKAADKVLSRFLDDRLARYETERNEPQQDATSGLSPYLHFGHISVHQVFQKLMEHDQWSTDRIAAKPTGKREGWWGASSEVESFLDELITWREVGFNMCSQQTDYHRYESLPDWARKTLEEHADDPREYEYDLEEFERAQTHDELWNAAQRQLVREGRIHNYLRMLWGKKIFEWTPSPREALRVMIELNNKFALDGRDPNSYSGIFWCLGRYDRAWGPERPVYGKIRYMTSQNTARKYDVKEYLEQYGS